MNIAHLTTKQAKPPGPKGAPIIGCAREMLTDRLGFLTRIARTYGDIVHFKVLGRDFFLVNQPDMAQEMTHLTLGIVAKALFDADVHTEAAHVGAAMDVLMHNFMRLMNPLAPLLMRLPLPGMRKILNAERVLNQVIYRLIGERRAEPGTNADHGDLWSMLLLATDEQGQPAMSDAQIRDEAMTLFLAGHETTANALAWTWYLLAQHPQVEARLRSELHTSLRGRLPSIDDLPNLPYTR